MKTIVEINSNNYASTGKVTLNIAKAARKKDYKVYTFFENCKAAKKFHNEDQYFIGIWLDRIISEALAYITGLRSHFNILNTYLLIKKLTEIKPDIIHLHLVVDSFINLKMLFKYIKKNHIALVWTFHDGWAFTGQCVEFDYVKCDKWKTGCGNCPIINHYPGSLIDLTAKLWKEKKQIFNSIDNFTIVTPSYWLENLCKLSFLKNKKTITIHNGINLDIFKPIESDFIINHSLENKKLILGVSYGWSNNKGLDTFIKLAKELPNNYQIVLVGTNEETNKLLPDNILSIPKTYNQEELIKIYTDCDLFVNPTIDDNFPTVNLEALACGTPVLTYDTGGSKETIDDTCGAVVNSNDYLTLKKEIIRILEEKPYSKEACLNKAKQFDMNDKFAEYVKLYDEILKN